MNLCIFKGRLVAKPVVRKTSNDVSVANFTIAVEERRQDKKTKEWTSDTEFLDFEIWDSGADVFSSRYDKGDLVIVQSKARVNKWKDKDTDKEHRTVRFRVDKFDGLSKNAPAKRETADVGAVADGGADDGDTVPF